MIRDIKLTHLAGLTLGVYFVAASLSVQAQTSRSATASSYRARGLDWLSKGRPDLALTDFEIAITFDPKSAMGFYCRSLTTHCGNRARFDPTIPFASNP
jgi:Tfp pilus assembly protein PilF